MEKTEIKLDKTETKIEKMQRELEDSKAQTQAMKKGLIDTLVEKKNMTLEDATIEADKVEARARAKARR